MFIINPNFSYWLSQLQIASNVYNYQLSAATEFYLLNVLLTSISADNLAKTNQIYTFVSRTCIDHKLSADQCLIIAGMFPEYGLHLGAGSLAPIIWAGQNSYHALAKSQNVYCELADDFLQNLDLLLYIRFLLTQEVGSEQLLQQLHKTGLKYPSLRL